MTVNKVIFVGYVGRDPEVRYLPNGDAVCNISVASTERWKDGNGEQQERTEWLRCNAFGKLAEIIGEYVKQGTLVYVEGKLQTRKWTDKDGIEKYTTEARLDVMRMLGGQQDRGEGGGEGSGEQREQRQRPAQRQQPQRQQAPSKSSTGFDDMDDDVPF